MGCVSDPSTPFSIFSQEKMSLPARYFSFFRKVASSRAASLWQLMQPASKFFRNVVVEDVANALLYPSK